VVRFGNMLAILFSACIMLILPAATAFGQAATEIMKIKFRGNETLSASLLRQALDLSRTSGSSDWLLAARRRRTATSWSRPISQPSRASTSARDSLPFRSARLNSITPTTNVK